jgi:hypothetical protein
MTSHKMLVTHPAGTTDSFTLYVKASIILGKIKLFNVRFRSKYCEEPQSCSPDDQSAIDPRDTAEFQVLDTLITSFRNSFPKEFKDPVLPDGKVDPVLYVVHVMSHT